MIAFFIKQSYDEHCFKEMDELGNSVHYFAAMEIPVVFL